MQYSHISRFKIYVFPAVSSAPKVLTTPRQINCSLDIRLPFIHSYLYIQVTNIHLTLNHFHQVIVPNLILFSLLLQANNKPTNYLICGNINQFTNKGCIQCRDLSMFNTLIGENFGFTITRCSFCDFFRIFHLM